MMLSRRDVLLRVSDLRQYEYCPRVVFYQYVLPVESRPTYKMEKGKATQQVIERLEARRKLRKFGLQKGTRKFNIWMMSENLGLSGKVDMLIETHDRIYPVDFKFTRGRPRKNHVYQLAGYSLILDDIQSKPATEGFVYLILQEDAVVFEMDEKVKDECRGMLQEIRDMIQDERFPEAPSSRAKCTDCEYQNYCRDVW